MRLITFFNMFVYVRAIHFRGGLITWKPLEGTTKVEVTYRITWQRSSSGLFCDNSTISNEGEGTMYCWTCSSMIPIINPMTYNCTDFDVSMDWTSGINSATFDYSLANSSSFYVGYSDCCWAPLVIGGIRVAWSVMTLINTTAIDRNGVMQINNSPVTSISPVLGIISTCYYTIKIPVTDLDGDIIRCRWAEYSNNTTVNECGLESCQAVPNATLIEGMNSKTAPHSLYPFLRSVTRIKTFSPPFNWVTASPERLASSDREWYSNVTWTPTLEQTGEHIFCFTAMNFYGFPSEERCIILVVAGFSMNSYACDPHSGGVYQQSAKIPPFDDFQIAYCLSAEEVLARTNFTTRCADSCRAYCYLTCMTEKYGNHNFTEVTSECLCNTLDTTDAETQLPSWCLIPQGKCDFFDECISIRFSNCDKVSNLTTDLQKQCLWFADKALNENCSSSKWVKDVRKCFQSYLMTSIFRADLLLCSDFTDALYFEAYAVCFADTTYDVPFCDLPLSFRMAFNNELVPLIPLAVQEINAVSNLLISMKRC